MDEPKIYLDERVGRMEAQLASLADSMKRFADSMTSFARMDERVAQLLVENRSMGERLGKTQDTLQLLQVELASLKVEVLALKLSKKDSLAWVGRGVFYVISLLIAIVLARYGVHVGP